MAKFSLGELKDTITFIIGGGPSFLTTIPDRKVLYDKVVFSCNNAYKIFPNSYLTHFSDYIWYTWHSETLHDTFKGKYITTIAKDRRIKDDGRLVRLKKRSAKGISKEYGHICGSNSGHQTLNIAVQMGCNPIVLIGFDLDRSVKKGQEQWHKEHKRDTNTNLYEDTMIPNFEIAAEQIKELGIEVYNVNPNSKLTCFDYKPINRFL